MEGSSAPAIGSRRFAARANRESAAQLGIRAAERRERLASVDGGFIAKHLANPQTVQSRQPESTRCDQPVNCRPGF